MIDACHKHGVILAIACHLNWYNWYTNARQSIVEGTIGSLRSMICHSPSTLSNLHSHTLALFRLFADAPAKWVFGVMDSDERAAGDTDLSGSGYIVYENGVRAVMNTQAETTGHNWTLEFIGDKGRIVTRNATLSLSYGVPIQRRVTLFSVSSPILGIHVARWWMRLKAFAYP